MAESATSLKGLRAQMAAAAQAQAEERRSLSGNSPGPTPPSTTAKPQGPKPVIDGAVIRIDEKLRVAKERREEADRQQALRDNQIVERERKAKLQVERQMEERQKKLDEQRRKEEQKRSAVEEKRKLKAEEEKEHYEAVMRRTLERSQRVEQRQKRWSWGGLSTDSDGRAGDSDASVSSPVAIEITPASPQKPPRKKQVDKRSTSTMNLKQSGDAAISKRLSTSSATLIKTPDKTRRAQQACVADGGVLSRLLTPTQASLARSKSAAALSADGADAAASASPLQPPPRGPLRSRSIDRQKSGMTGSVSADGALDPSLKDRRLTSPISQRPPSPSNSLGRNRSPSPAPPPAPKRTPSPAPKRAPSPAPKRTPSPAAAKQGSRSRPPSPGAGKQRPPSPQPNAAAPASKPPPIQKPALTPTGPQTLRKRDSKSKDLLPGQPVHPPSPDAGQASAASPSPSPAPPAPHSKSKDKDDPKAMVGTSSKEEAAKMLAENRRLAREQKEKDELLRVQREEEERLRKEEEQRLAEVARLEREEQQKRQAEEKAQRDEEEALLAEEDRVRLAAEEALRQEELQREREEAEARALEEAERVRVERERVLQQNQQERMERKKRIEEIMKRTRKGEDSDKRDGDDDDKDDQDDGEDDVDDIDCEAKEDDMVHHEDADGEADGEADAAKEEECCVAAGEPVSERQTPVGSVNGQSDTDDKENNNDMSTDGTQAVSPIPKSRLVEGSEFLNEEDASKAGLVPGVNGKPGPWSFEELIDLNVHSKSRPLLQSEDRNQGLIDCDGASDGPPRGAFEDNGAPGVKSMHSSPQPLEALAEV
ncbi:ensconsin isoform X7 [Gadus macrocephalus]|uniref:ensconsin isoform X7 n=1 Tax=Gadus macrocephalus TaxID=80720 RepID=UPI0028CB433B|nr:ensconsin isoform X7 [Gadus macrocephalus]